ncbi:hypothetical protein U3516DRAFT_226832 [Neocallimastix sp. 'constans']
MLPYIYIYLLFFFFFFFCSISIFNDYYNIFVNNRTFFINFFDYETLSIYQYRFFFFFLDINYIIKPQSLLSVINHFLMSE